MAAQVGKCIHSQHIAEMTSSLHCNLAGAIEPGCSFDGTGEAVIHFEGVVE